MRSIADRVVELLSTHPNNEYTSKEIWEILVKDDPEIKLTTTRAEISRVTREGKISRNDEVDPDGVKRTLAYYHINTATPVADREAVGMIPYQAYEEVEPMPMVINPNRLDSAPALPIQREELTSEDVLMHTPKYQAYKQSITTPVAQREAPTYEDGFAQGFNAGFEKALELMRRGVL